MRATLRWITMVSLLCGCAEQRASDPPEPASPEAPGAAAIEERLYPAALVLDHQAALGLDAAQLDAIRAELHSAQRELVDAEVALRGEREALATALAADRVDEAQALAAAERVVQREGAIKLLNLRTLVRIKNHLTAAQQRQLDELRR